MNKQINIYEEASRCLLCQDAPCSKACKTGDPARAIRASPNELKRRNKLNFRK